MDARDGLWAARVRKLAVDEQQAMRAQLAVIEARLREAESLVSNMRASRDAVKKRLEGLDARLKKLDAWQDDPVVLVRTSVGGHGRPVYHDGQTPCGHVSSRSRFKEILLGEAEELGLEPCFACGGQANRPAARSSRGINT